MSVEEDNSSQSELEQSWGQTKPKVSVKRVEAVRELHKMKGSAGSHVFQCDDSETRLVKFYDGSKTVALEFFGSELAKRLALPAPGHAVVTLSQTVLDTVPDLKARGIQPGQHHGVTYYEGAVDLDSCAAPVTIVNSTQLAGVLAFDTLTYKTDTGGQNHLLVPVQGGYSYTMIDLAGTTGCSWQSQTLATTATSLTLTSTHQVLVSAITDMALFEPTLKMIEGLKRDDLEPMIDDMPSQWGVTSNDKSAMVEFILARKSLVRPTLYSNLHIFPLRQKAGPTS